MKLKHGKLYVNNGSGQAWLIRSGCGRLSSLRGGRELRQFCMWDVTFSNSYQAVSVLIRCLKVNLSAARENRLRLAFGSSDFCLAVHIGRCWVTVEFLHWNQVMRNTVSMIVSILVFDSGWHWSLFSMIRFLIHDHDSEKKWWTEAIYSYYDEILCSFGFVVHWNRQLQSFHECFLRQTYIHRSLLLSLSFFDFAKLHKAPVLKN